MKFKDIEKKAVKDLAEEKNQLGIEIVKDRIEEIKRTEKLLKRLKKQYTDLLKKDIEDVLDY